MVSPVTRRPSQAASTPTPAAATVPDHSCPSRIGKWAWPSSRYCISPVKNSTSVPHTPTRVTSTTTWPGPAAGASTSWTAASYGAVTTNARMVLASE